MVEGIIRTVVVANDTTQWSEFICLKNLVLDREQFEHDIFLSNLDNSNIAAMHYEMSIYF